MRKIKLLVMDVDGTLTDGCIYMGAQGEVMKAFNVKDGYAIANLLPQHGIIPVIITGRTSEIVARRSRELHIEELHQGVMDKLPMLEAVMTKYDASKEVVAYIGDDLNDLPCMEVCGYTGCPADAVSQVKAVANYVCEHNAGFGAVREFIDHIIGTD